MTAVSSGRRKSQHQRSQRQNQQTEAPLIRPFPQVTGHDCSHLQNSCVLAPSTITAFPPAQGPGLRQQSLPGEAGYTCQSIPELSYPVASPTRKSESNTES